MFRVKICCRSGSSAKRIHSELSVYVSKSWTSDSYWLLKDSNTLQTWKSPPPPHICLNISETPLECVMMFLSEPVLWTFFRCRVCAEKARIARIRTRKRSQIFPQLLCIQSKACSVTTTAGSHSAFTPTTVNRNEALNRKQHVSIFFHNGVIIIMSLLWSD